MRPASLSATALNVAELCPARYKAEHIDRTKGFGSVPANLGTAVHGTLELYTKACYLPDGVDAATPSLDLLIDLYRMSYMQTFSVSETVGEVYDDGLEMIERWYKRTDINEVQVLSSEVKENFPLPTSIGDIPFNYIWDRFDRLDATTVRVVDYKTNRWSMRPEDLKRKVQARCYAVAAAIKAKQGQLGQIDRVFVQFDLLRHDPVGVVFSREENAACWQFMKRTAEEKIIAIPDDDVPETLNAECRFCVRLLTCNAVKKNIAAGGTFAIGTAQEAVDIRATLDYQAKAIQQAIVQLDEIILKQAQEEDVLEYESDMNRVTFKVSSRRAVDAERIEGIVGEELFKLYGGPAISMAGFDKLLKDKNLSPEKKAMLKGMVYTKRGEPTVSVEPKNPIDED